jgi:hypothetical protein
MQYRVLDPRNDDTKLSVMVNGGAWVKDFVSDSPKSRIPRKPARGSVDACEHLSMQHSKGGGTPYGTTAT